MQLQPIYRALTDRGRRRERNEDAVDAGPVRVAAGAGRPWHLLVVADGVGGHQRGDWASQLAVATLREEVRERLSRTGPGEALRQAFQATNQALWRQTSGDPARDRAATTLVAALVDGDQLDRVRLRRGLRGAGDRVDAILSWTGRPGHTRSGDGPGEPTGQDSHRRGGRHISEGSG